MTIQPEQNFLSFPDEVIRAAGSITRNGAASASGADGMGVTIDSPIYLERTFKARIQRGETLAVVKDPAFWSGVLAPAFTGRVVKVHVSEWDDTFEPFVLSVDGTGSQITVTPL